MKPPSKILVFRQSSLGDVILTLPVLDCLFEAFPGCRIDYVTKTPYRPVIECHPAIDRVFDFASSDEFRTIGRDLREIAYDTFIDLQANFRSHYLGLRLRGARTIRYKKRRLARELIVRRPGARLAVEHTVLAYLRPLSKLDIAAEIRPPVMHLPTEATRFADDYFLKNNLDGGTIIALCPGAKHREKMWPWENYRDLALMLLHNPHMAVLVFSASGDDYPGDLGITNPRLNQARGLGLAQAAALLSRCRAAITNDSGLMHLANAVGARVVAIFGPTHPRLGFAPILPGSRILCDDVPCSPCSLHGQRKCYQPRKFCFEKITPKRISRELDSLMGPSSNAL